MDISIEITRIYFIYNINFIPNNNKEHFHCLQIPYYGFIIMNILNNKMTYLEYKKLLILLISDMK